MIHTQNCPVYLAENGQWSSSMSPYCNCGAYCNSNTPLKTEIKPVFIYPNGETIKERGYFGIAFYEPKFEENIGTAIRNAHCFGADFISVIGKRYERQPSDTMATERHIPIYEYEDLEDFLAHIPLGCELVIVECDGEDSATFIHPQRAIYLLGGEDRNAPNIPSIKRVRFPTSHCVNMAVASGLILYDRKLKSSL